MSGECRASINRFDQRETFVFKRTKQLVVGAATTATGVLMLSSAAFGAHTVTPSTNLTDGQLVTVSITGLPATSTANIIQCNNDQGAAFDVGVDCAPLSLTQEVMNASGAGTKQFAVKQEPQGYLDGDVNWRCDPTGTADGSTTIIGPVGDPVRVFSVCRIRVNSGSFTASTDESFQDITFASGPGTEVPEAPYAVLFPIAGAAVAGGAYLILRGRRPATFA